MNNDNSLHSGTEEHSQTTQIPPNPFDLFSSIGPNHTSTNLVCVDAAIKELNQGQKQFNQLRRIGRSRTYRGYTTLRDKVRAFLGKEPTVMNIYAIFRQQQSTVRRLNRYLETGISSYKQLLPRFQTQNDTMFAATAKEAYRKKKLESELQESYQLYQQKKEVFESTEKSDIDAYYSNLQQAMTHQRKAMALACELKLCTDSFEYFDHQNEVMVPFDADPEALVYSAGRVIIERH